MNLNKRELNEHVEFESQTYYAAFAAELEACAQPMWGLLTHCKVKVGLIIKFALLSHTMPVCFCDGLDSLMEHTPQAFCAGCTYCITLCEHFILSVNRRHRSTLKLWYGTVWRPFRSGLMPLASLMR